MGNYYSTGQVTIAYSDFYDITAYGAQGGNANTATYDGSGVFTGGLGSEISGQFYLSAGTTLIFYVGSRGQNGYAKPGSPHIYSGAGAGGGGGSFVIENPKGTYTYVPILVAGGGGGASVHQNGYAGVVAPNGTDGGQAIYKNGGAGGTNGGPGLTGPAQNYGNGGGGGFIGGSGGTVANPAADGQGQGKGYTGGSGSIGYNGGGFGGGGGGGGNKIEVKFSDYRSYGAGGGGGGWGGGGGGGGDTENADSGSGGGGGGGSLDTGTYLAAKAGVKSGNGEVVLKPVIQNDSFAFTGDVQTMTIAVSGFYDLTAYGAQGGSAENQPVTGQYAGGLGAEIEGRLYLAKGSVLEVVVGGAGYAGTSAGGGGGGGSFIIETNNGSAAVDVPLLIAGGGGGASNAHAGYSGNTGTTGGVGGAAGGTGGAGGYGGASGGTYGGGGGGFSGGDGGSTYTKSAPQAGGGKGTGYAGGAGYFSNDPEKYGKGGFGGGGGGARMNGGAGGGGGYGGGGGGGGGARDIAGAGGGGGSLDTGTSILAITGENSGNGQVEIVFAPCFLVGTRILTPNGEIGIESLRPGDLVTTQGGRAMPVAWVGSWKVDLNAAPRSQNLRPVRIAAGALGDGVPHRDLYVSPDHSLYLGGALIPARLLLNGVSITQPRRGGRLKYYHIQIEPHDILFAEGAPAESFLDLGNTSFTKPGEEPRSWEDACAPLLLTGAALEKIKARLAERNILPFAVSPCVRKVPASGIA